MNWSNIYVKNYYAALHLMHKALFLIELEFKNTYIYIYIFYYWMNDINIVQGGCVYKYFPSTSAFFHSCCEITVTCFILNLQFASHFDSHVLLLLIYC